MTTCHHEAVISQDLPLLLSGKLVHFQFSTALHCLPMHDVFCYGVLAGSLALNLGMRSLVRVVSMSDLPQALLCIRVAPPCLRVSSQSTTRLIIFTILSPGPNPQFNHVDRSFSEIPQFTCHQRAQFSHNPLVARGHLGVLPIQIQDITFHCQDHLLMATLPLVEGALFVLL